MAYQEPSPAYGRQAAAHRQGSRYDEEAAPGGGYEMGRMDSSDPNRILNECRAVDTAVDSLEHDIERLNMLHKKNNNSPDNAFQSEIDALDNTILAGYRNLVARIKTIKQQPESGSPRNAPQVGKVDRKVKTSLQQFERQKMDNRNNMRSQQERQYRIVRPDASDQEVREAIDNAGEGQIFSQALISSSRRGDAYDIASNVKSRHEAIQKIEQDMMQLAEMFQDLEALVVQQEAAVTQIEQSGEQVSDHVTKATGELDGAVDKARAARKKKWLCLGIVVLIIIVIAVVVAVAVTVTKK